jgi:hypothetical protein
MHNSASEQKHQKRKPVAVAVAVAAQSGRRPLLAQCGAVSPAAKISEPAAQKSTKQQQALTSCTLTQAPSTKHQAQSKSKSKAVAGAAAQSPGRLAITGGGD